MRHHMLDYSLSLDILLQDHCILMALCHMNNYFYYSYYSSLLLLFNFFVILMSFYMLQ